MGNNSSRYVKRYEHHLQTQNIQKTLHDVQRNLCQLQEDSTQRNKRVKAEIKVLIESNEAQTKALQTADCELQVLRQEIRRLKELDDVKIALKKVTNEHVDDRMKLKDRIKELVGQERENWDNDIFEMKERYEKMRKYSMELITMDLAHEREIKDLQKQISFLQEKKCMPTSQQNFEDISQKSSNILSKDNSSWLVAPTPRESLLRSMSKHHHNNNHNNNNNNDLQRNNSYDLKFSKINMAMKRLQDDLKYSEVKQNGGN